MYQPPQISYQKKHEMCCATDLRLKMCLLLANATYNTETAPGGEPTKVKCNYNGGKCNCICPNVITFAKL